MAGKGGWGYSACYEGATCKCGHGVPPLWVRGRYRGLCEVGKAAHLLEHGSNGKPGAPKYPGPAAPCNERTALRLAIDAELRRRQPWQAWRRLEQYLARQEARV